MYGPQQYSINNTLITFHFLFQLKDFFKLNYLLNVGSQLGSDRDNNRIILTFIQWFVQEAKHNNPQ